MLTSCWAGSRLGKPACRVTPSLSFGAEGIYPFSMVTILSWLLDQGVRELKNRHSGLFPGLPQLSSSGGVASFLQLCCHPVIFIFIHLCILSLSTMCLLRASVLAAEALGFGTKPQESNTAEEAPFLTRATKRYFVCSSLVADQFPADTMRARVSGVPVWSRAGE